MNVCPICEASLSHQKTKRVTAPILKPTDDQKPETFIGGGGGLMK